MISFVCLATSVGVVPLGLIVSWLLSRLYIKCVMGKCTSQNRLDGKVVIITGANSGIGNEAAKTLALRGAKVLLACRNKQRADKAASDICKECPGCNVVVKQLDLSCLQSIRDFAVEVLREETRLDILVNNAGLVGGGKFKATDDGFEEVYQANYLGPFYLTELLLHLLKKSAPSRIVNTGSSGYILGNVSASTLSSDVKTDRMFSSLRYGDTKLAMLMWTRGMAEELKGFGVTINVLHPGVVATSIVSKEQISLSNIMLRFNILAFGRTVKEGAQTLIHLCLADEVESITGKYWSECRPASTFRGRDKEANRQLIEATRRILGLL